MERAIISSCITGHRAELWKIPALDKLKGAKRDEWINSHNDSSKKWNSNDWKNAGREARQSKILPINIIETKLQELGAVIEADTTDTEFRSNSAVPSREYKTTDL